MQVVKQRAEYVAKQAAKKALKKNSLKAYDEAWSRNHERSRAIQNRNDVIRRGRKHRREDWELGPLAPRRDVGDQKENYGTAHVFDYWLPKLPEGRGPETWHISEGDRVVVVRGRDRGTIGVVKSKDDDRCSVTVEGVNLVDLQIPDWMRAQEGRGTRKTEEAEASISISDVRLVYPLPDPETGIPRDVIIEELVKIENPDEVPEWQRDPDEDPVEPIRAIPGSNIIIPRPERAPKEPEDGRPIDTKLIQLEEPTFRPYLLHPPMPMSVIDELRNKYSRYRTRHTWEYIEKKEAEDARAAGREKLMDDMLTPLQQLAKVRKEKVVDRDLSDDQLAKIGAVIARERGAVKGTASATPSTNTE